MTKKIIIGARGSKLSKAYVNEVIRLIKSISFLHDIKFEIKNIKTTGDIYNEKKISDIGGKNFFCKEVEECLSKCEIDIAVHSLKDMETYEREDLKVGAYLKRNDARDVLILKDSKVMQKENISIGSSSKRRELQIKLINKKFIIKNIRGNIDTRVNKVNSGEYDGIILAAAGVNFLRYNNKVSEHYPIEEMIPSAGQGTIAVQCRKDDKNIINILEKINNDESKICALAEKSLLKTIGGDCHTAVGAYACIRGNKIKLIARLFSDDGTKSFFVQKDGDKKFPEEIGKIVGLELLDKSKNNYNKKR